MKKIIFLVGILAILISGCNNNQNQERFVNNCDECKENENCWYHTSGNISCNIKTEEEMKWDNYRAICFYPFYEIIYVDELLLDNCYAIRQNDDWEYEIYRLEKSFNNTLSQYEYFKEQNMNCEYIDTKGIAYCLNNKTTCMILEDNKICDIIKI